MALTDKSFTVSPGSTQVGWRIDRVVQALCGMTRGQVAGLFDQGCVRLNASACSTPARRVVAGDKLRLRYDPTRRYRPKTDPRRHVSFDIVFEDRHLIVVTKPASVLTVPTRHGERHTLVDQLSDYLRHVGGGRRVFPVHRLDRGVSGLLVFGKTSAATEAMRDQFARHLPRREYVALVTGRIDKPQGTFSGRLATARDLKRFSTRDAAIGEHAVTHFRVTERLADTTLVTVWLETGRRNQIRVHFAESGHPVLGDPRYEPHRASHRCWPYKRLALHASLLAFDHPISGRHLRFVARLPAEMRRFINAAQG